MSWGCLPTQKLLMAGNTNDKKSTIRGQGRGCDFWAGMPWRMHLQEVTDGVTTARLPEPANTVDEWKASLDSPALAQAMALSLSH